MLLALAIFLLALFPRMVGLETSVTTDEIAWAGRTGNFARALDSGQLQATFLTGHPAVTTMWIGLLGMGPDRAQRLSGDRREVSRSQIITNPEFLTDLAAARGAMALAMAAAVAGSALLTWRLLGPAPAIATGALLALDPFYLAHSQLLAIDAPLSTFMTLALLAGLVRWLAGGGRGYLLLSAASTALALLSKAPALFLIAYLPLLAALASRRPGQFPRRLLWTDLLAWSALVAVTYVLCWPAMWAAPAETLEGVLRFVRDNANPKHAAIAEGGAGSGAFFYAASFALRTTPAVLVGLALLALEAALMMLAGRRSIERPAWATENSPSSTIRRPWPAAAAALLAYVLIFGLAMTVSGKSFDRYLLPAFPAVDVLAGLGLALGARRLRWLGGASWLLAGASVLPLLVYPLATSLPYPLTWYSPLAGGGPAAQQALSVGWGEGLDQVARYLNAKPAAERLKVSMPGEIYTTVLDAQFAGQVAPAKGGDPSAEDADYFVTYIRGPQEEPPVYDHRFQSWQPEFVVRLADVDYARVYPASLGVPIGAAFDSLARLEGYGLDVLTSRPGRPLNLKLFWRAMTDIPADARVVLLLLDESGRETARAESHLGPLDSGRPRARTYQLLIPPALAAGEYQVWVALEAAPGRPVPIAGRPESLARGAPEDPGRVVLRSIQVR